VRTLDLQDPNNNNLSPGASFHDKPDSGHKNRFLLRILFGNTTSTSAYLTLIPKTKIDVVKSPFKRGKVIKSSKPAEACLAPILILARTIVIVVAIAMENCYC
jgi:hypothetical protein